MRTDPVVLDMDLTTTVRAMFNVIIPMRTIGGKSAKPIMLARDAAVAALIAGRWPNAGICQWLGVSPSTVTRVREDPEIMEQGRLLAVQCDKAFHDRLKQV